MPTYEYGCENCSEKFEFFQKISSKPIVDCPKCNKPALKRAIGGGSSTFHFKGSGFYITDYKNKKASVSKDKNSVSNDKEKTKGSQVKKGKKSE